MNSKTKNIIGWTLAVLVAVIFIGSGLMKLTAATPELIKGLGGASNVQLLGILELVIVILFLIPRTGVMGALLLIA